MRRVALIAAFAALVVAAPASAGLWGTIGGDIGRSGVQAFDGGTPPYRLLWSDAARDIVSSVIVSNGQPKDGLAPRVIFATKDGRVHLRDLYTGEIVGKRDGTLVSKHANKDALTGFGGSITPVESSLDDQLGQIYVLMNDRFGPTEQNPDSVLDEIAIAQVDERSGRLVQYALLPGTEKQVASSSPVLTPPDGAGNRSLLFTATNVSDSEAKQDADPTAKLYRMTIRAANTDRAVIDTNTIETQDFPTLNPLASPAGVVGANDSGATPGRLKLFATVSGRDAASPLQSFLAESFCPTDENDATTIIFCGSPNGPASQKLEDDATDDHYVFAQTPSVPLAASGIAPGLPGSQSGRAPAVVVATFDVTANETTVHRLAPTPDGTTLIETARSAAFPGRPAPQLAVTQLGVAGGDDAGRVLLTTGRNLYALDGGDLSVAWKLDPADALKPGDTGFAATTAAVAGTTVFAVRDNGQRLALRLADGTPLGDGEFDATSEATATVRGIGAPAPTAAGIVLFASDKGVVALADRCGHRVIGTSRKDAISGTLAGEDVSAGAGDDEVDGKAGDDCLDGGDGNDTVGGDFGEDRITGGPGDDALLGGSGNDTLDGESGDDRIVGEEGADTVLGGSGADRLKGGSGGDTLDGADGEDRLYGDSGDDKLDGGALNDRLSGASGNDVLRGGPGRDILNGGSGNDDISAGRGAGSISAGPGKDQVNAVNGKRDTVHCGSGRDSAVVDRIDRVFRCESVRYGKP